MKEKEYIYKILELAKNENIEIQAIYLEKKNFDNIVNHIAGTANRIFDPVMNEVHLNTPHGKITVLSDRHKINKEE